MLLWSFCLVQSCGVHSIDLTVFAAAVRRDLHCGSAAAMPHLYRVWPLLPGAAVTAADRLSAVFRFSQSFRYAATAAWCASHCLGSALAAALAAVLTWWQLRLLLLWALLPASCECLCGRRTESRWNCPSAKLTQRQWLLGAPALQHQSSRVRRVNAHSDCW